MEIPSDTQQADKEAIDDGHCSKPYKSEMTRPCSDVVGQMQEGACQQGEDHTFPEFMANIGYPEPPHKGGITGDDPMATSVDHCESHEPTADNMEKFIPPVKEVDIYQNAQFDNYTNWPFPASHVDHHTALIYDWVRSAGAPNYRGARIPLPSPLNHSTWSQESTGHTDDEWITKCVRYGFPIQYTGGPCYTKQVDYNHPSAEAYSAHVDEYFQKETASMAMSGPYAAPPVYPLV